MNTADVNTISSDEETSVIRRAGRFSTFLLIFLLTALTLCCFFGKQFAGLISTPDDVLEGSVVSLCSDGKVCVVSGSGNSYSLRIISADGEKRSVRLKSDSFDGRTVLSDVYALSDGRFIISYYTGTSDGNLDELVLGIFDGDGKELSRLYSASCETFTPSEPEKQRQTSKCYAFSENGGKLYYVVRSGVEYSAYSWQYGDPDATPVLLTSLGLSDNCYDAITDPSDGGETVILAMSSGKLAFIRDGEVRFGFLSDRIVSHFMQGSDGIYFIDGKNNTLNLLHYEYDTPVKDDGNGEFMIKFPDQLPVTFNSVLYVPIRFVAEALGYEVVHNPDSLCTTIDSRMFLYIGSDRAAINGENVTLDNKVYLISDRTMVSKTFIETYLNCTVIRQDGEWYLVPFKVVEDETPVVQTWDEKAEPTDKRLAYNSQYALSFDRLWKYELNQSDDALLVSHDGLVILARGDGTTAELTETLTVSNVRGIVILCAIFIGAVFLSALLTYLVYDYGRRFMPLALRVTLLVTVCVVIVMNGLVIYFIEPRYLSNLIETAKSEAVVAAKLSGQENSGEYSISFDSTPGYVVYEKVYGEYIVSRGNMGIEPGTPAKTAGGQRYIQTSLENEGEPDSSDGLMYDESVIAYSRYGYGAMAVYIDTSSIEASATALFTTVYQIMNLSVAAVALIVWLILWRVQRGLWIINRGVDLVATGKLGVDVACETGDELETLAVSFNGAVGFIRSTYGRLKALSDAYRRFVPEQLVRLLGEESIESLTKKSHTTHEMVAMVVWFSFSDARYEHDTSKLFDNINGVIERTSSIVSKNGGAVYNFAYDGFDAVFDGDPETAVSVAVAIAQEAAAMNAQRSADDCRIRLCVTLDRGNVMMGIIGDENRMAPTAISSSLTTARHLTKIARTTDSSIICTENLSGMLKNYHSRYIGKTLDGSSMIRMYEIYDGDALQTRQSKDMYLQTFTEAIFAFYSCDFARAKELFMSILKHQSDDGVARHYLYLSDKYSSESPKELYISPSEGDKR